LGIYEKFKEMGKRLVIGSNKGRGTRPDKQKEGGDGARFTRPTNWEKGEEPGQLLVWKKSTFKKAAGSQRNLWHPGKQNPYPRGPQIDIAGSSKNKGQ